MPRAADLGIRIGLLPPGPTSSVLDVPGVGMGHTTVRRDEPEPPDGRGVARTGVTVIRLADDTFRRPASAGGAVLNGAGECTGFITAGEWGCVETPVCLTSTLQVGRVYDAACELMLEEEPSVADDFIIPVVAECDDSYLNDARRMQVTRDDVAAAWAAARESVGGSQAPSEGSVGAGTGMSCLGFKGGIGTASRLTPDGHTVAVVLLTNFGDRARLTVDGVPVGRLLLSHNHDGFGVVRPADGTGEQHQTGDREPPAGSCIGIVVTDAPVDGPGCARLARRVGLGLARTGSVAYHGSGEIFLACSVGLRTDRDGVPEGPATVAGRRLDPLFAAVVEASEEAVLNSMLCSPTTVGRSDNRSEGLPAEEVVRLLRAHGRL